MYERYTENARQAIFFAREEASKADSPYIEPEHLLLAIMRSWQPELNEVLKLRELENTFRADLPIGQQAASPSVDIPLSNQNKRILAYAAEEAVRLDSPGIDSRHLLLGILREPTNLAARFLLSANLDLQKVRRLIAMLPNARVGAAGGFGRSQIGWTTSLRRRFWMGAAVQLALLILLGAGVAKSGIAGRHLLVIAAIWCLVIVAWLVLGRGFFSVFRTHGKYSRVIVLAVTYALLCLYQLFLFGWLIPLGVGIYRVAR
jgi:hypothetical protein